MPIILCGDFNSDADSAVYNSVKLNGFSSSFATVHNREPGVTHKDHRGRQVLADYILYKNNNGRDKLRPTGASLFPIDIKDGAWDDSFECSDHRPLIAKFIIEMPREKL